MIKHSELARALIDKFGNGEPVHQILVLTSGGVEAESSPINQAGDESAMKASPIKWPDTVENSGFIFGNASKGAMLGVHPTLIQVATLALRYTKQDFRFYEGGRSVAQQRINVNKGVSKTMDSKHLKQVSGYYEAMDLVPIIGGIPKWDWNGCYLIAVAVDRAATELGVANHIRWGGVWDRTLDKISGGADSYASAVHDYAERHPGKDFLDGPHFEYKP